MKNSDASKHHSISKRLSFGLVITLLVVAGLSLFINFMISSRNARAELEIKSNDYCVALADALRLPIWRINVETIEAIGESYSQNEFVSQLLIEGQDDLVYFKIVKPDVLSKVSRSKDILYKGKYIGRVHIALSLDYYQVIDRRNFWSFSLTIIAMIGSLLVMTSLLLRQFLNRPMTRFIEMVNSFAEGNADAFKRGIPYNEFLTLANVLDEMGAKLESQKRSLEFTQHAVDKSSVAIYWIDPDAQITYANDAANQITGYSLEELKKVSLFDIEDSLSEEFWQERLEKLKLEGSLSFESVHICKNFYRLPVEVTATWLELFGREYICAFVSDITKRKKAEAALRESRDYLENLTDSMGDVVFSIKMPERKIEWIKDRFETLGYRPEECIGKGSDFFYADRNDYLAIGEILTKATAEGKDVIYTVADLRRKNGEIFPVEATLTLYRVNNEVVSLTGILRDVSVRKSTEEKLLEYQRRLKALASQLTIAEEKERRRIATDLHDDVCQSLALVRIQVSAARKKALEPRLIAALDDVSETLRQTLQDTRHLMADLSSPSINEIGLSAAISELLEETVAKRHDLATEFSDDLDDHRRKFLEDNVRAILFRNVRELVTNVVKHARAKKVSVHIKDKDNRLNIIVKDDGIGFNPGNLTQKNGQDSGYGLFSIEERMSDLGGTFEMVSRPDRGSMAILTVPIRAG